jgi:hypothetical protein
MKQARQQSQDLRQTDDFLHTLMSPDSSDKEKVNSKNENSASRQMNGRAKVPRIDPISRFSDPPAPPPQQPLPEKPDVARRSTQESHIGSLKRSDTEKPPKSETSSPSSSRDSSQIMSLIEALSVTKKELEAQNSRVRELEDLLRQERSARESAEEKARQAEKRSETNGPRSEVEAAFEPLVEPANEVDELRRDVSHELDEANTQDETEQPKDIETKTSSDIQQRVDTMVTELAEMKRQVEKFKQQAEKAEGDSLNSRKSLADMIETLRRERSSTQGKGARSKENSSVTENLHDLSLSAKQDRPDSAIHHGLDPADLKELEDAVTALRQQRRHNLLENSTPYASMLGVVLLGVGIMAYLNGWQKIER